MKDQFCNFNEECTDRSDELSCPQTCNFEQRTACQWTIDRSQKLGWNFGSGQTASPNTGPSVGKYTLFLLIENPLSRFRSSLQIIPQILLQVPISIWKPMMVSMVIVLDSSVHSIVNHPKLVYSHSGRFAQSYVSFFHPLFDRYHMFGDTVDSLNIYVRANGYDTSIWSLRGNQGDKWLQGKAALPTCASEFNIIAEGVRGASFTGDIALDDFRFEQCYEDPPSPTCAQAAGDPNQFLCQSKHCIPKANTCDYQLDCCDGSDEDDVLCYNYQR